jgi:sn-glycerol 3-phosphate transport system permease protein
MPVELVPYIPILTALAGVVIGASLCAWFLRKMPNGVTIGGGIGALAGLGGAMFFMLPLNFCMFSAESDAIDAYFGMFLIAVGIIAAVLIVIQILNRVLRRIPLFAPDHAPGSFKQSWMAILFLAPTLIILVLFLYYPFLDTFRLSTLLTRLGIPRTAFVCVDNFTRLFNNPEYYQVIFFTIVLAVAIVLFSMSLALLIALAAYQPIKGARYYRTLLIWPYAISPVVTGLIFLLLFNPTGGIINQFLNELFGIRIPWLNSPTFAPWAVIIASVWKSLGFNILFYIAGLQNVPKDLLEAAGIDGANIFQRFWRITLPMLSPITFFLIITNTTYAFFDTFGTINALTSGGPLGSTTTMMYSVYEVGIQNNDLGKAAAQSIVLFILVIGLTVLQFRTAGRRVSYGA